MPYIYNYENFSISPNLGNIFSDVTGSGSLMENKAINYCRWDGDIDRLQIHYFEALSQEDKNILDQIVEDNTPSGA